MINRVIGQLRDSGVNPNLEILGVVMTMFDGRTRLAAQVVQEVRQHFGELVFDTLIPRTTRLAEAPSYGQPVIQYDEKSRGAEAYLDLAKEVLAHEQGTVGTGVERADLNRSAAGGQ